MFNLYHYTGQEIVDHSLEIPEITPGVRGCALFKNEDAQIDVLYSNLSPRSKGRAHIALRDTYCQIVAGYGELIIEDIEGNVVDRQQVKAGDGIVYIKPHSCNHSYTAGEEGLVYTIVAWGKKD